MNGYPAVICAVVKRNFSAVEILCHTVEGAVGRLRGEFWCAVCCWLVRARTGGRLAILGNSLNKGLEVFFTCFAALMHLCS